MHIFDKKYEIFYNLCNSEMMIRCRAVADSGNRIIVRDGVHEAELYYIILSYMVLSMHIY